jgi:hypothetical protein
MTAIYITIFAQVISLLPALYSSSIFISRIEDAIYGISDNGMEDQYGLIKEEGISFMTFVVEMHIYSIFNVVKLLQILTNSSAVSCLQVQSCIVNITF